MKPLVSWPINRGFNVRSILILVFITGFHLLSLRSSLAVEASDLIRGALDRAGSNRAEIEAALADATPGQRAGMEFLIVHMPEQDLKTLTAEYLLSNLRLAYKAWEESPWSDQISEDLFFNNILPYANINEARDSWRADFYERCKPIIADVKSPTEAAVLLNQKLFKQLNVKYSTKRNRADQGPAESIRTGLASCTGLSILLIDACRSVGIPARFVGTPLWTNKSGNHSWVEIWDDGWHFTGACEPTGGELDKGWFKGRASTALADHPLHAIYAVSYRKTPSAFPMVWAPQNRTVSAVNVTDRYTKEPKVLPEGHVEVLLKVVDETGIRLAVEIKVLSEKGELVFNGQAKDERFDANDHCSVVLVEDQKYTIHLSSDEGSVVRKLSANAQNEPYIFVFTQPQEGKEKDDRLDGDREVSDPQESGTGSSAGRQSPLRALKRYLSQPRNKREELADQEFSKLPLSRSVTEQAKQLLWEDHVEAIKSERIEEMKAGKIVLNELEMPFFYRTFGEKPKDGRSLYISMHGGGGAPPQVNDGQWENQKRLYTLQEGVYLVPRAPTNTWNLWHQGHIDGMFDRLIENMIVFEGVNPDKVYLMGYSAGGDGVYQLAPRMADRFAAAAMMAGHPNETSPLGLRNLAFTLHMGGKDSAYKRNQIAANWKTKLADLRENDPKGYEHWVEIYPDNGHWMDRKDASAIPWMAKYRRNRYPERVVWKQDDVRHHRFYWLAVDNEDVKGRALVIAKIGDQSINVEQSDVERLTIRLTDEMVDLESPVQITWGEVALRDVKAERTISTLAKTLSERGERQGMFSAEFQIQSPQFTEK